jgi:leucyl aminopeptidase
MIPTIKQAAKISGGESVVCVVTGKNLPAFLKLSAGEKKYISSALESGSDTATVNRLTHSIIIVKPKKHPYRYKTLEEIRKKAAVLKQQIIDLKADKIIISSDSSVAGAELAFSEGLILAGYSFSKYFTSGKEKRKTSIPSTLLLHGDIDMKEAAWIAAQCTALYKVRDLVNEPPNALNATTLGTEVKKMGKEAGFSVEVLTKGKIEALKMGGLLAVNRGSVDPPVFCILEWKPAKHQNSKPVVLVGKGVMYDTGGLNIKTGDYMAQMKGDMSGAAAVAGVMQVIASSKIPVHVIALIPATDNRPGGNAYTQGDILTMYNRSTVEVCNTDAEGRLILADAISYAEKFDPELIINIATLTGSAALAFGNIAIAAMGNAEEKYFSLLEDCGNSVYERIARMPFWEEYGELIKSDIADIKNVGGREAGAITAGKFLEIFAKQPLIHLDIAGTALLKKDDFYRTRDGSGSGMRLLSEFIRKYPEIKKKK